MSQADEANHAMIRSGDRSVAPMIRQLSPFAYRSRYVTGMYNALTLNTAVLAATLVVGCSAPEIRISEQALMELQAFCIATGAFHSAHGHAPPMSSVRSVRMHILSDNPHYNFSAANPDALAELDDAERLVFWLGGATLHSYPSFDRHQLYDFAEIRLEDRDSDGFFEYASAEGGVFAYNEDASTVSCGDLSADVESYWDRTLEQRTGLR